MFRKGQGRIAGRKKGVPNKLSASAKDALAQAFRLLGDVEGLVMWGKENRGPFYSIWSKLLPTEMSGPDGSAIQLALKKVVHEHHDVPAKPDGTD